MKRNSTNSAALTAISQKENTERARTVNVLGLRWNPTSDKLHLSEKSSILAHGHLTTKQEVLQDLSKIFDPLGFFVPVVIRPKVLMQKLWQLKITWDEPLNNDLQAQWRDIATDLKATSQFSVSRRYSNVCISQPTIHCFADASQHAYGAIVFLIQSNQVSFVIAKARAAPLKALTIPRLELMAALVATHLTHFVLKAIPSDIVHMWSDSQIVLHWIMSQKLLPVFVHHRTAEIQSLLPQANWGYCPTSENQLICCHGVLPLKY